MEGKKKRMQKYQPRGSHVIKLIIPPLVFSIFLFLLIALTWQRTSGYTPDTIRYVDAAMNFKDTGRMILTRYQLYFPFLLAEWKPRPLTEQPPLYPALIAATSLTGLDGVTSARVVSTLFYILLPFIMWPLIRDTLKGFPAIVALIIMVSSYGFFTYSVYGLSESLGVFLLMSVLLVSVRVGSDLRSDRASWSLFITLIVLYTLSVAVRFSNAFVLPALLIWLFFAAEGLRNRGRLAVTAGICLALTVCLFSLRLFFTSSAGLPEFGPLAGSTYLSNAKKAVMLPIADILFGGVDSPIWNKIGFVIGSLSIVFVLITILRRSSKKEAVDFLLKKPEGLCGLATASYIFLLGLRRLQKASTRCRLVILSLCIHASLCYSRACFFK